MRAYVRGDKGKKSGIWNSTSHQCQSVIYLNVIYFVNRTASSHHQNKGACAILVALVYKRCFIPLATSIRLLSNDAQSTSK